MAHHFLVLELIEAESIASLAVVVIELYVCDDTFSHLQLYVLGGGILLLVLVERLEVLPYNRSFGDDIRAEIERERRDERSRNHIWPHQSSLAHTCGQHRDNLAVACQFRRKEDYGNENKQRREKVGKVGHEVHVVIKHNSL